jgi:broad specificity phosphatase PhoE
MIADASAAGGYEVVVVRHGETAWTISGQHTSRTDVPLTDVGRRQAQRLAPRLAERSFAIVLTSPLQRARETCALAGFQDAVESSPDLVEWDYGAYEGRTTAEIRADNPSWSLWSDGAPGGETPAQVARRADRVLQRLREAGGHALVFSHGHFLRVLAARWLEQPVEFGRLFVLSPASISTLGWEREQHVLASWNLTP